MSIARRLRRKQSRKENHVIKWKDCSLPAKLFFDEVIRGNYHVLGNAPESELQKAYWSIIDEYVKLDKNEALKDWFNRLEQKAVINNLIQTVSTCLYVITYASNTEELLKENIETINSIKGVNINFDLNKGIDEEIIRVNTKVLGLLRNRIKLLEGEEQPQGNNEVSVFEKRLVAVQNVLGYNLPDDVSLKKFIFLEKAAIEKSKPQPKHG